MERIKDCVAGCEGAVVIKKKLSAHLYVMCKGDVDGRMEQDSDLVGSESFTGGQSVIKRVQKRTQK